jgi:hypothetical protein
VANDGFATSRTHGLSLRIASETIAGAILGTPAYMSPEQARGTHSEEVGTVGPAYFLEGHQPEVNLVD